MTLWRLDNNYIETATRFFGLLMLEAPENPLPRDELHHILKAQGKFEDAKKILTEALENLENVPSMVFYDYAILLKEEGMIDEAIQYMKKAADIEINHLIEHELAHLYFEKEDYVTALRWYEAALASAKGVEITSMQSIAHCCFLLEDYRASAIMLMEILLLNPSSSVEYWNNLISSLRLAHVNREKVKSYMASTRDINTLVGMVAIFDQIVEELSPEFLGHKRNWLVLQERVDPFEH
jgi:tetratricopeptide (TPR) repeat protein